MKINDFSFKKVTHVCEQNHQPEILDVKMEKWLGSSLCHWTCQVLGQLLILQGFEGNEGEKIALKTTHA